MPFMTLCMLRVELRVGAAAETEAGTDAIPAVQAHVSTTQRGHVRTAAEAGRARSGDGDSNAQRHDDNNDDSNINSDAQCARARQAATMQCARATPHGDDWVVSYGYEDYG